MTLLVMRLPKQEGQKHLTTALRQCTEQLDIVPSDEKLMLQASMLTKTNLEIHVLGKANVVGGEPLIAYIVTTRPERQRQLSRNQDFLA